MRKWGEIAKGVFIFWQKKLVCPKCSTLNPRFVQPLTALIKSCIQTSKYFSLLQLFECILHWFFKVGSSGELFFDYLESFFNQIHKYLILKNIVTGHGGRAVLPVDMCFLRYLTERDNIMQKNWPGLSHSTRTAGPHNAKLKHWSARWRLRWSRFKK